MIKSGILYLKYLSSPEFETKYPMMSNINLGIKIGDDKGKDNSEEEVGIGARINSYILMRGSMISVHFSHLPWGDNSEEVIINIKIRILSYIITRGSKYFSHFPLEILMLLVLSVYKCM